MKSRRKGRVIWNERGRPRKPPDPPFSIFEHARRKAKFGHRDWLILRYPNEDDAARLVDLDSIDMAIVCVKDGGKVFRVEANTGTFFGLNEAILTTMRRNAERGLL